METRRTLVGKNRSGGGSSIRTPISQVSVVVPPSKTRRAKERKKSRKKKKQRRHAMVAEEEVEVVVAPIAATNNNQDRINTRHTPNPRWDKEFKKDIGKQTAVEYMTKHYLFPTPTDFVVSDKEDEVSYYNTMKKVLLKRNKAEDMAGFDVFFCENRRIWKKTCNDFRTMLVNKAKLRYFSKYDNCLRLTNLIL